MRSMILLLSFLFLSSSFAGERTRYKLNVPQPDPLLQSMTSFEGFKQEQQRRESNPLFTTRVVPVDVRTTPSPAMVNPARPAPHTTRSVWEK